MISENIFSTIPNLQLIKLMMSERERERGEKNLFNNWKKKKKGKIHKLFLEHN